MRNILLALILFTTAISPSWGKEYRFLAWYMANCVGGAAVGVPYSVPMVEYDQPAVAVPYAVPVVRQPLFGIFINRPVVRVPVPVAVPYAVPVPAAAPTCVPVGQVAIQQNDTAQLLKQIADQQQILQAMQATQAQVQVPYQVPVQQMGQRIAELEGRLATLLERSERDSELRMAIQEVRGIASQLARDQAILLQMLPRGGAVSQNPAVPYSVPSPSPGTVPTGGPVQQIQITPARSMGPEAVTPDYSYSTKSPKRRY